MRDNMFDALEWLQKIPAERGGAVPLADVELLAPIPRPRQDVVCLGMNYRDHAEESARYSADAFTKDSAAAVYFSKRVSEAGKPGGVIPRHAGLTDRLDYEAELAVVLGKAARDVKAADAADYIFGYTVLNDVSARDLQTGHKQWYFGKSLDGFTPMGPVLVTADEIAYPPALEITSHVNGELRQKSNTALLITSIGQILEELTAGMTLLPGTIIATGTPAGVGMGFDPPRFLQSGDTVECTIEGIGTLRSTVI
ncbi:MAG: fumarylacetoacetate hydrolase family protein [Oscillibacter sp.]|nr:fumarylacetoacetate hydrolase family protein [Oscillibacter sp.]